MPFVFICLGPVYSNFGTSDTPESRTMLEFEGCTVLDQNAATPTLHRYQIIQL